MIDVAVLPTWLDAAVLADAQVVVLDVLRASSTIMTALANGAADVRLFANPEAVRTARQAWPAAEAQAITGGERGCLKISGFDLGNSPAEYTPDVVSGATVLLSTTNGTRAALAVRGARDIYIGCLLNAEATAAALLANLDRGHTLLVAAGTDGKVALEDVLGAGAILWHILESTYRADLALTDTAWLAYHAFGSVKKRLPAALRLGAGGQNLIRAGLESDIDRCAALNSQPIVAQAHGDPPRVMRSQK